MILVDTATLAVALGITPRQVRQKVADGEFVPRGQWGRGSRRGRPGWFFDLDNLKGDAHEDDRSDP